MTASSGGAQDRGAEWRARLDELYARLQPPPGTRAGDTLRISVHDAWDLRKALTMTRAAAAIIHREYEHIERLAAEIDRLERSRSDLRERNRQLREHDACDWKHKAVATQRGLERVVEQLRDARADLDAYGGVAS